MRRVQPRQGKSYELREALPTVERFQELRAAAGMSARSREGVERGLPNSVYGVTVVEEGSDTVGMARIVGDGGSVYHVCDMVVHPDHQLQGLGTQLMDAVMAYLDEHAPPNAYVNLTVDVDGFYEHSKIASRFSRTSERAF
ncbi:GNAT family N-acetyltransferase [Halobacterium rubrum]|uniref:GNAT family N-acetyltransferase n=1 Tax=Halobacterium TaxID=2239 RepID=UPI001F2F3413|nr:MULTISPECIES: GNAT family N-acetyltransferase [Halobacterium]MDH5021602.1 GNAT family N-acetyltransferase [Halobacterium rubrum]